MYLPHPTVLLRVLGVGVALTVVVPMAPATAVTELSSASCGAKITGNLTLTNDLSKCAGDGLVVGADNITIDLNGHTLDGTGNAASAGVRVAGFSGVIVKGGVIREFGRGIWLVGAENNQILGNTVRKSTDEGIFANESSDNAVIAHNTISGSGVGSESIWADGIDARGDGVKIRGNTVGTSRDDGIDANGNDVRVRNNTVDGNGADGIDVDGHDSLIENNLATDNGDDGIGVGANALQVTVKDNTANQNYDLGIQPKAGTAVDGGGNQASENGDSRECVRVLCS